MKIKLVKCTLFPFIFLLYIYCTPVLINAQNLESYISKLTGDPIKYAIYYPKDYLKTKKYPMLVYLHGMDEKGWPVGGFNPTIRKTGLPLLIESGLKLPFIIIAPCCCYSDWDNIGYTLLQQPKSYSPGTLVIEISKMAIQKYPIDTTRLYITGLSMGGGGVFSAVQNFPDFFNAAIPIAGWGNPNKSCDIKTTIWAFQGENDGGEGLRNVMKEIKKCNPLNESKASILQKQGHVIWDKVYRNEVSGGVNIYEWLMKYTD